MGKGGIRRNGSYAKANQKVSIYGITLAKHYKQIIPATLSHRDRGKCSLISWVDTNYRKAQGCKPFD